MANKRATVFKFGYIPHRFRATFSLGRVEPIGDFDVKRIEIANRCNRDGFLYPPTVQTVNVDPVTKAENVIPNSERPAGMYRAPVSHAMYVTGGGKDRELPSYIIHLLAFFSGGQAQFSDWFVSGRLPVRTMKPFHIPASSLQGYIDIAEKRWLGMNAKQRLLLVNILYCRNKLHTYEWPWEKFAFGYMVLDAIWRLHDFKVKGVTHPDRIKELCSRLDVRFIPSAAEKIAELRRDLFHESLWAGGIPGHVVSKDGGEHGALFELESLINLLVVRSLGIKCALPPWNIHAQFALEHSEHCTHDERFAPRKSD